MALRLGRGGRDSSSETSEPNRAVVHELQAVGKKSFSGAVEITDKESHASATVYLLEGGIYAATLAGYVPPIAARLWSSGALDRERSEQLLADLGGVALDPRAGSIAAQHGWVKVDTLGTMHQEYLLASLGAVLALSKPKVKTSAGNTTSSFCTLPIQVEAIFEATRMRRERMTQTWSGVSQDTEPQSAVPVQTGEQLPASITIREARLVADASDGVRSLDEIAWRLGLTRAEAVHLVGVLVRAEVLTVRHAADAAPRQVLWVPEEFGRDLMPTPPPVAPARPPVAEPDDVPATDGSAAMPLAAASVVAMNRDADVRIEPLGPEAHEPEADEPEADEPEADEPEADEPENGTEDADTSGDIEGMDDGRENLGVVPLSVTQVREPLDEPLDEHVRQLRVEVARNEVAELQEALQAAVRDEMDMIAKAAAIRARLHGAEQALAELASGDASG
jgi:hypothetical protein